MVLFENRLILQGGHDAKVDRVAVFFLGSEGRCKYHVLPVLGCEGYRVPERKLVLGERSGLVRTEHVDAGHLFNGFQTGDDRLHLRQSQRSDGHGDGKDRGHGHGNRRDRKDQGKLY